MEDNSNTSLSPLKQALLAIEKMRAKLYEVERAEKEPIAIIGIGCRFPGGANDLNSFWRILREGVDAIVEIPSDRWNADAFYDSNPHASGKMTSKWGGFIEDIDKFDPQFFGISPREAKEMDPQQRMMLEVTWEALENAGQAPDQLSGSQTAVFTGVAAYEYSDLKMGTADLNNFDNYYISGCGPNMLSGRISYFLGLHGPSVTLDTACSSSLTAIHLACQSLRLRECEMAITGGTNEIIQPHLMVAYSKAGLMAKDGRCKTFDASADGLVRGEGCGVLILKRLSDALDARDHIHAIIRGSAVNQDGPSSGLSAPNGPAQTAVIREALRRGMVDPLSVGYVEAHGTGTSLGDPIEVQALGEALCKMRSKDKPLYIGSVKTNFGHLEGAAGVVGLIKTVLVLKHAEMPPNLHFRKPNTLINWEKIPVVVPTNATPWQMDGYRRIAGVSAFGFGGTNVHVVLEQAPEHDVHRGKRTVELIGTGSEPKRPLHLFTLSAKNENSLMELSRRYVSHLNTHPSMPIEDICFTANAGRSHFDHRLATIVASSGQLYERMKAFSNNRSSDEIICKQVVEVEEPKIAFIFTGQGPQYVNMGKQLYETQQTFRKAMDRCEELLRPYLKKSLSSVLYPKTNEESPLNNPSYAQPALFALEYSLAELWRSWGIEPSMVMGKGMGEYVAAHVAKAISLKDALKIVSDRGKIFEALANNDNMATWSEEDKKFAEMVRVAEEECVYVPGIGKTIARNYFEDEPRRSVYASLAVKGVNSSRPMLSYSLSSEIEERTLKAFYEKICEVSLSRAQIPVVSCVSGRTIKDEIAKPEYWLDHLQHPSKLQFAIQTLHEKGCKIFVEIGPGNVFLNTAREMNPELQAICLSTLKKDEDDWHSILNSLSSLYVSGASVNWVGFEGKYPSKKTALPTYPFSRKKYWSDDRKRLIFGRLEKRDEKNHPIIGKRVYSPIVKDAVFEACYRENSPSFLIDHRIHDICLMPGAGYLAQSLIAANEVFGNGYHAVEQLHFMEPMVFEDGSERTVQFVLTSEEGDVASFKIFSIPRNTENSQEEWILHAKGLIRVGDARFQGLNEVFDYAKAKKIHDHKVNVRSHFQGMEKVGAELGPSFQGIEELWHANNESIARLILPKRLLNEASDYAIHPVILDTAIQTMGSVLMNGDAYPSTYLPIEVERYHAYRNIGTMAWCRAVVQESNDPDAPVLTGDITLYDESGRLSAILEGVHLKRTDRSALRRVVGKNYADWLYEPVWRSSDPKNVLRDSTDRKPGAWLIFGGFDYTSKGLIKLIEENGETAIIVTDSPTFDRKGNHYYINCKQPEDYRKLFRELNQQVHCVVFLWSAMPGESSEMSSRDLEILTEERCGGVLYLVQAMIDAQETTLPKLWIVTRGATSLDGGGTPPAVIGGALWGFGGVVSTEHPELSCARIDLDPSDSDGQLRALFNEVRFSSQEDQITFRGGRRYVARLIRYAPGRKAHDDNKYQSQHGLVKNDHFRDDASYLITGGLGSLGLQVARWMARKGALQITLMGRSDPSKEALEVIEDLEHKGVRILVAIGDVTLEDDVARIIGEIKASMLPLRGVIHAAGILDDALLLKEKWEHFARVLAPKVSGSWNLHAATKQMVLDFFIMFSSTATLLPNYGQSSYATANAFLNSLAHHRRSVGLSALSINWGVWSGGGMAATVDERDRQRWFQQGVTLMEPSDALRALEQVIGNEISQVAIFPIAWSSFFRYKKDANVPVMLSELSIRKIKPSEALSRTTEKPNLQIRLNKVVPNLRLTVLREYIIGEVTKILKLDKTDVISTKKPLFEAGLDSLMTVELRNTLSLAVGRNLPATLLFKYSTIEALTEYLATEIFSIDASDEKPAPMVDEEKDQEDIENLESLSDEEISRLLDDELKSLPGQIWNEEEA